MSNLRNTHKTYTQRHFSFEGHVKSVERNCNSLIDVVNTTKNEEFANEVEAELKTIREKCANLRKIADKYKT